jgi:hypothetical protein
MAFVIRSCLIIAIFVATLLFARSAQCASSDPFGGHHTREVVYSSLLKSGLQRLTRLVVIMRY